MASKFPKFRQIFGNVARYAAPAAGYALGGPAGAAAGGALGEGLYRGIGQKKRSLSEGITGAATGAAYGYGGGKAFQGLTRPQGFNPLALGAPAGSGVNVGFGRPRPGGGGPSGGGGGGSLPPSTRGSGFGFGDLGGIIKNPLFSGLATMLGSQFIRSPKVPELPESVRFFQQQATQGTPIGNLASERLTEGLNQPFEQVSAEEEGAALRQIERQQEDELRQLTSVYKSLRPGTDILSDSSYARDTANLNQRYADLKTQTIAQLRRQVRSDFNATRAQQILSAQGIDAQRLIQLAQAGQIDMDRLIDQFNIEDRDKLALREYLLSFGGEIVASQIPTENPYAFSNFGQR